LKKYLLLSGIALIAVFILNIYIVQAQVEHSNSMDKDLCFECHGQKELAMTRNNQKVSLYVDKAQYEKSVHGTRQCVACHNFDENGDSTDARTMSEKCGSCHYEAWPDYQKSDHFGSEPAPTCAECHGSHNIGKVTDSSSPSQARNQYQSCGQCHEKAAAQYQESFHGKAVALGAVQSPSCTGCHGAHKVLSSQDLASPTSEAKTPALCAQCHKGNVLGLNAVEHYTMSPQGFGAPMYWVKKVFMWLILLVVGFFLTHILLDLFHKLRTRRS